MELTTESHQVLYSDPAALKPKDNKIQFVAPSTMFFYICHQSALPVQAFQPDTAGKIPRCLGEALHHSRVVRAGSFGGHVRIYHLLACCRKE